MSGRVPDRWERLGLGDNLLYTQILCLIPLSHRHSLTGDPPKFFGPSLHRLGNPLFDLGKLEILHIATRWVWQIDLPTRTTSYMGSGGWLRFPLIIVVYSLNGHPSGPSFRRQVLPQSSSIHPYLVPKCSVNFPASVQADFHWVWAGLQWKHKGQSRKIHTFK